MNAALLIARLLLAAVFTLAGVAKLADRQGSRQAIIDFGVPSALAAPLRLLLPLAELAVAATLLPASTAWWGALGALVLLSLFVVGISVNLARGRTPECHCFGQLHSAPVGWRTLARNGVLATVAGFVLWEGYGGGAGPSAVAWLGVLSTAQLLGLLGGVLVLDVPRGSEAERAGMEPAQFLQDGRIVPGSVITSVEGEAVDTLDDLLAEIDARQAGDEVAVTFATGDDEQTVELPLLPGA